MIAVLDTCALLWLTLESDSLSPKAHKAIAGADRLVVSAISVWEIGIKNSRKKLDLGTDYMDYVGRLSRISDVEILPVGHMLWERSSMLDWEHRDPADRVIVALATELGATLISDDAEMKEYFKRVVS
jgi:PIN domain nuclease of toxin-antitoxin system